MKILFTKNALEEYNYWKTFPKKKKRIDLLIKAIANDPFKGIGKPEPLKFVGSGIWSRRIDQEHRIVYQIEAEAITILQCRFHY